MSTYVRRDYIGPWAFNREDRCWKRWYRERTDYGFIHVHYVWLEP